ncbi:MAG TPA: indole-3-glycerol phosphate synthase TrpC [Fibrobacteria bacterium]|nr:indole-3-glycerol phosphate synthase TrpC [Fibrobacteria bacterium]
MPSNILDKILKAKAARLADLKGDVSLADIEAKARGLPPPALDFLAALAAPKTSASGGQGIHVIAEVKKASPSRGVIRDDFKPLEIAKAYQAGGASALSVLTEEDHFQGHDRYLRDISRNVGLPTLRKDFIVDPYQIFEAKVLGASAYLLIVACLKPKQLASMIALGAELKLTPLVEVHTEEEVKVAVDAGSPIIGINNRDLKTFLTSLETTYRLRPLIPDGTPVVSESGIFKKEDLRALAGAGIQAALIGESLIKQKDVKAALAEILSF